MTLLFGKHCSIAVPSPFVRFLAFVLKRRGAALPLLLTVGTPYLIHFNIRKAPIYP